MIKAKDTCNAGLDFPRLWYWVYKLKKPFESPCVCPSLETEFILFFKGNTLADLSTVTVSIHLAKVILYCRGRQGTVLKVLLHRDWSGPRVLEHESIKWLSKALNFDIVLLLCREEKDNMGFTEVTPN